MPGNNGNLLSSVYHLKQVVRTIFSTASKCSTQASEKQKYHNTIPESRGNQMEAWQIETFGTIDNVGLTLVDAPIIKKPGDVLIKVKAVSVNPLDIAMIGGYGNVILNTVRQLDFCTEASLKPLILGRDFAGVVIAKGNGVRHGININDRVYGVVPPHLQGCHAEQVVVDEALVTQMPADMDYSEASGILYAGLTAWSALQITGDLYLTSARGKRILVLGASGGVGTIAVQLLKAWGAEVVATCSTEAIPLVTSLKPDRTIDYTMVNSIQDIGKAGKYDVVLDASGRANSMTYVPFLKDWCNAKFITLRSPVLKNTDDHGLVMGMACNVADIIMTNVISRAPTKGSSVRWGFFVPVPAGVQEISNLVLAKRVKPIVQETFSFKDLPAAYKRMSEGHLRGKIAITLN